MKQLKFFSYVLVAGLAVGLYRQFAAPTVPDRPAISELEPADSPVELSRRGWKLALLRTKAALKDKDLTRSAAGLAYYATLSFFPIVLGVASLYVTIAGPHALQSILDSLRGIIPTAIHSLLLTILRPLTMASRSSAGLAAILSIVALLWTMSGGLQNLIKAVNFAYDSKDQRGFIKLRGLSLLLSLGMLAFTGLMLGLLLLQTKALHRLGAPSWLADSFPYFRWLLLVGLVAFALAFVYRYAPYRREPRWQWVSWGAAAAGIIWLIGTFLFFIYAQNFSNFNKTYGVFAGLVVLMSWFNLSALIILVGAQVNKKLEEVTSRTSSENRAVY